MITRDKSALMLAVGLAGLAGFTDAVGFIELGGFFVSFMSGNSTRFAVGVAEQGAVLMAALPLGLIALFVAGVMAGAFLYQRAPGRHRGAVLAFVAAMLLAAAVCAALGYRAAAIVFMLLAMGAENNVFVRDGQVDIGLTYMTGTLVKLGQKIVAHAMGRGNGPVWPLALLWAGLMGGAVMGAFGYALLGLGSLWVAAAFAALLWLATALKKSAAAPEQDGGV